jgi:pimeloyl-ACP methyl ester carboxylesterase
VIQKLQPFVFQQCDIISVDLRGHGGSTVEQTPESWREFADDVLEMLDSLNARQVVGVGHSFGGHIVTQLACADPARFPSVVLVDPTLFRPEFYGAGPASMFDFVRKRRAHWASESEFFAKLRTKVPYSFWLEQAVRDYAKHGLRPRAPPHDAHLPMELACSPAFEALCYALVRGSVESAEKNVEV